MEKITSDANSELQSSGKSKRSHLNNSISSSLPSEYYVSAHASLKSFSSGSAWTGTSFADTSQNERSSSSFGSTNRSSESQHVEQTCCDYVSFTPRRFRASSKFRKCPHNTPLLLVYFMFGLLGFIERGSFLVLFYSLNSYNQFTPPRIEAVYLGVKGFVHLLYPVAGFLSDTYFGKYKVILVSLNMVWLGSALLAAGFTRMDPIFTAEHYWSVGCIVLTATGYTVIGLGLVGIRVNLIPFGVDQMQGASSGELSSYFHWYYWWLAIGEALTTVTLPYIYVESFVSYVFLLINIFVSVFIVVLVSAAPKFEIQSNSGNPLRLIANVTRYALSMRKRRPLFQSAFHVGKPQPSLMDKALQEYGGRYTLEQVEDVKTFYRILFILISFIGYFAIFSQIATTTIFQGYRLKQPFTRNCTPITSDRLEQYSSLTNRPISCSFSLFPPAIGYAAANLLPLLLLIPLFDRLIYICLNGWRWFSMLGRIGIGKIFIIVSTACALLVEVLRVTSFKEEAGRSEGGMLQINAVLFHTEQVDSLHVASDISVMWVWPQYIFFSIAELFCNITAVEFIYAQSPAAMKGLLLGLFFATEGVSMMLSSLVILILGNLRKLSFCSYFGNTNHVYHEMLTNSICFGNATHSTVTNSTSLTSQQEGSCIDSAICAYIIFMMVALLSIIVFIVAACRYKLRKRDPDPVFPFWLYPENQERENACKRALRVLCFCVRDKDWQI